VVSRFLRAEEASLKRGGLAFRAELALPPVRRSREPRRRPDALPVWCESCTPWWHALLILTPEDYTIGPPVSPADVGKNASSG